MIVLVLFLLLLVTGTELLPLGGAGHAYLVHSLLTPVVGEKLSTRELIGLIQFAELAVLPSIVMFLFAADPRENGSIREWTLVLVASVPAGIAGAVVDRLLVTRLPGMVTAIGFLCTSLVLALPYFIGGQRRRVRESGEKQFCVWRAIGVGGLQVISVFGGISRLGMVLGGGALAGLRRRELFRFGLLTAVPFVFVRLLTTVMLAAIVGGPFGESGLALTEFFSAVSTIFVVGAGLFCFFVGVVVIRVLEWILLEDRIYLLSFYLFLLGTVYTWSIGLFLEPPIT